MSFCWAFCKQMEPRTKHLKTDLNSPISILPYHVSTNIFCSSVLEITAPQNDNFECVHRERKNERKEGKKTREELHECCASHRIKKARKLAKDHINAVLRTALKTREGLHKCYASHRIKDTLCYKYC